MTPLDERSARRRDLYQTTHETDIHNTGKIRTHNPSKREAADPRLRTRGHWNRLLIYIGPVINGIPEDICFEPEKKYKKQKKIKLNCCINSTLSSIVARVQRDDGNKGY
jgi:hypothetical protein